MTTITERRVKSFVLWRPATGTATAPAVVVGKFQPGNPSTIVNERRLQLGQNAEFPDLWELPFSECGLTDGVYHYWLEVENTAPGQSDLIRVPDPFATALDYRVLSDRGKLPASVVKIKNGKAIVCDPDGTTASVAQPNLMVLPPNHKSVVYELPTSWSRGGVEPGSSAVRDVGSFQDVLALLDRDQPGANFADLPWVDKKQHIRDLGINVLELLPVTDSLVDREWGYAPAHYLAPDADLGFPYGYVSPAPNVGLAAVVNACHELGIRVFADMVMAFGYDPYRQANFPEFHIDPRAEPWNPDAYQSSRYNEFRDGFGGASWRFQSTVRGYDPVTGSRGDFCPAQQFMLCQLARWMNDFRIDGIRIDSVNNIASWNFLQAFREAAHSLWNEKWPERPAGEVEARFTVVGEELAVPIPLITERRLDGLWNEKFQPRVRGAILGQGVDDNFEWTVRKIIDCRNLGFSDGAQAINYLTSHDVEGFRKERMYNFLENNHIWKKEERIKLAFVCLMTAVGIPMILAGEEFADQHDRATTHPDKQRDPVNFERMGYSWRRRIYEYVARLVQLRKTASALSVNDTQFIHLDFSSGRRVLAWLRGRLGIEDPIVVVANFSDAYTDGPKYYISNWPATPPGKHWREFTQERDVPNEWAGAEPLYPWEAKVYGLVE
jgi:pullulanase